MNNTEMGLVAIWILVMVLVFQQCKSNKILTEIRDSTKQTEMIEQDTTNWMDDYDNWFLSLP